jgi:glycosyltransferase involved in cell wall biosynthesis
MNSKKKILFISYAAYPLFNENVKYPYGGAELDLYNISLALNKDKFDVHFIVADFGQKSMEMHGDISIHKSSAIKNCNSFQGFFNFIKLFFLIRRINPDIYFSEAAGWLTVELIIMKILLRKKFVFRSSHIRNINGHLDTRPCGKFFRKLISNIDCFILQNKEDEKIFKKNYSYERELQTIRNLQNIPPKNRMSFSERDAILWIGRSEKIKNPELFLNLAKRMSDKNFLMIMPNTNPEIFNSIFEKSKTISNLKIIAGVNSSKIIDFFKKALYFVSTSESEGFPNVILEAMKTGTPVISYFLDYDKIIQENNCGLIGLGKIDTISDFIHNIPEKKWAVMSENCYTFANNNFDISKGIKEYEKIFLQL